jgi:hypothetical protein
VSSQIISGRVRLRKSPRKSSWWDLFPEPNHVTNIRWLQIRITFSLWKNNGLRKPEMFYKTFECYHLNKAPTQSGPKHYLCYKAWAHTDLYREFHVHVSAFWYWRCSGKFNFVCQSTVTHTLHKAQVILYQNLFIHYVQIGTGISLRFTQFFNWFWYGENLTKCKEK